MSRLWTPTVSPHCNFRVEFFMGEETYGTPVVSAALWLQQPTLQLCISCDRLTDIQTNGQTDRQTNEQTDGQTDRRMADRQTNRQTDRQTDRQMNRWTALMH